MNGHGHDECFLFTGYQSTNESKRSIFFMIGLLTKKNYLRYTEMMNILNPLIENKSVKILPPQKANNLGIILAHTHSPTRVYSLSKWNFLSLDATVTQIVSLVLSIQDYNNSRFCSLSLGQIYKF